MICRAVEVCVVGVFFNNCCVVVVLVLECTVTEQVLCVDEPNQTAMTLLDLSFLGIKKGIDLLTTDTILPFLSITRLKFICNFM